MITTKTISCPKCKTEHRYPVAMDGNLEVLGCKKCGVASRIDIGKELPMIAIFKPLENIDRFVEIGTEVSFDDKEMMVVGMARFGRKPNTWTEHLLMAEDGTRRFLTESEGHWTFYEEFEIQDTSLTVTNKEITDVAGPTYKLHSQYKGRLAKLEGCFDYVVTDQVLGKEYVHERIMIVSESLKKDPSHSRKAEEPVYFWGSYVPRSKLKFAIPSIQLLNSSKERHILQPNYFNIHWANFCYILFGFGLLIGLLHWFSYNTKQNEFVLEKWFDLEHFAEDSVYVSQSFEFKGDNSVLEYQLATNVQQSWVAYEITLINEQTQEERTVAPELSFYSGYSDDGYWTEGFLNNSSYLCCVAPGKYHMEVKLFKDYYLYNTLTPPSEKYWASLKLIWDPPLHANFTTVFWVLSGLIAFALFLKLG